MTGYCIRHVVDSLISTPLLRGSITRVAIVDPRKWKEALSEG